MKWMQPTWPSVFFSTQIFVEGKDIMLNEHFEMKYIRHIINNMLPLVIEKYCDVT